MTTDPTLGAAAPGLINRVKNLLLTPQAEWDRIAGENPPLGAMLVGHVAPLAAAAALAAILGSMIFVGWFLGIGGLVQLLVNGVLYVVLAVGGVALWGVIINALAPSFGSEKNQARAHQLSAYGATAVFVAGLAAILPMLWPIAMLAGGVYTLVLIYIGLPRLLKTPEDKRMPFVLTIAGIAVVAGLVMSTLYMSLYVPMMIRQGSVFGLNAPGAPRQAEMTLPGGGTVNLSELEKAADAMASGEPLPAIDPARLEAQLPPSLPGGFTRTALSTGSAMGTSQAEGVYENGDARLELTVMHTGAMGAMATVAMAANVQEDRQDANGYSRTRTVEGRVYNEEVSNSGGRASYGVIGRGVAITAEGSGGATIDQARAAVETVGVERLERTLGGG